MKPRLVGLTQRIHRHGTDEWDCLSSDWWKCLRTHHDVPYPLPNDSELVREILAAAPFSGVILTGGGDVFQDSPIRDRRTAVELELLKASEETSGLPLLGVCRGMQRIAAHYGHGMGHTRGHAGTIHDVLTTDDRTLTVNSFHDWAIHPCHNSSLHTDAISEDGNIEAFHHDDFPIVGVMWHPERPTPGRKSDYTHLTQHFKRSC